MSNLAFLLLAPLLSISSDSTGPRRSEFVFIVHKENAVEDLSWTELHRILTARTREWPSGESIELLLPKSESLEKRALLHIFYKMTDGQLKQYWTRLIYQHKIVDAPRTAASAGVAVRMAGLIRGSLAIVPAYLVKPDMPVKPLMIEGKRPGDPDYLFANPVVGEATPKSGGANKSRAALLLGESPWAEAVLATLGSEQGSPGRAYARAEASFHASVQAAASAPLMRFGTPEDQDDDVEKARRAREESLLKRVENLEARIENMGSPEDVTSNGSEPFLETPRQGPPTFHLRGFGHIEWEYEDIDSDDGDESVHVFGHELLDLLITSQLAERLSFLTEVTFTATDEGEYDLDVERVILDYRINDMFSVKAGRFLTTMGYWSPRFHHGEWLQTSSGRPEVLDFEDDTGLLPIQMVGLGGQMRVFTEDVDFDLTVEVGNGRGATPDMAQIKEDGNRSKAVNVAIGVEPACLPGLRFGGGGYWDRIPENDDATLGGVHGDLDERILSAYIAYDRGPFEIMAEFHHLRHKDGPLTTDSTGWYVQVAHHIGDFTPYVRADAIRRDDQETYWEVAEDLQAYVVGVRWDAFDWMALTFQWEQAHVDAPPGDPDEVADSFGLQASFTF